MTGTLRSTARNPVFIVLMGLLILVFLISGAVGGGRFTDAFRGAKADSVVTAGAHDMSANDYARIFEQDKQRYEEQTHQETTNEFLIRNGFDQQLLNEIALDQSEAEMLARAGIRPDAALVDAQIKQNPAFFDSVTGKFSDQQFLRYLARIGLSPTQAQAELGDLLAQKHFGAALQSGFRAPRAFVAMSAIAALQSRDVSYFILSGDAVVQPQPPTDAQLRAYLTAHATQLTRPETRIITLARFSAHDLAPSVTVTPAEIQSEFDRRKASLSSPETRTIIQIPVKTAADASRAAQRLEGGEDPAAIARAYGAEPVVYADKARANVADAKIAAVAFTLKAGQVAGPVQGDLGLAAIKVVKITPAKVATLDSAKAGITADLATKAARDKAYALSQAFDEARQAGSSIADAARKAGVTSVTLGPVTAQGAGLDGQRNPLVTDKIAKTAFTLKAGEDSDVQDAEPGEYYALRVEKVLPPALPTLDQVRAPLTQAYMREGLVAALRGKADALMEDLRRGKPMAEVASSVGAQVTRQTGMRLIQAQQYQALGRDFLGAIFGQKSGAVFDAGGPGGVFIAKLDAVTPGDLTTTAELVNAIEARASADYLRDVVDSTKSAAREAVRAQINLTLARKTMNVDPATMGPPGATGKTGGKPASDAP
jgi:peptidyl-prolyl cis-trans isomerase D